MFGAECELVLHYVRQRSTQELGGKVFNCHVDSPLITCFIFFCLVLPLAVPTVLLFGAPLRPPCFCTETAGDTTTVDSRETKDEATGSTEDDIGVTVEVGGNGI